MKEYQYSIIRRESRNPKRNREGRGISQSDLEALKQELEGNSQGIVSAIYDRDIALDSLTLTSTDISERLGAAEEALTGKLDSGDFSKWRTGDYANRQSALDNALAGKQPVGSYVDPSQLDASKQQAVAEAVERAEELDKKLKVGGRNLIRAGYFEKVYFRSDTDKLISYDDKDKKITYIGKASRWNSWVWLSDMEDVTTINLRKAIGEYTLSFSVRGRGTVSFEVVGNYKTNYSDYKTTVQTLTEDWQRVSCPFTRSAEDSSLFCLYNDKPETGDWVQFADDWKLERGTVATDWTPAPEDLDDSISKVNKSLTSLASTLLDPDQGEIHKLTSQLATSQQQAVDEAVRQAGEMDKQIKVGGRNLIRNGSEAKRQCGEWVTYRLYKPIEQSEPLTLSFDVIKVEKPPIGGRFLVFFFYYSNFRTATSVKYEEGKKRYSVSVQALNYNYDLYGDKKDYDPDAVFIYPNSSYDSGGGCFTVSNVKLERGTIATDWTPAPEDVAESVSKVSKSLEELSDHPLTVDKNGFWKIWSVKDGAYKTTQYQSRGEDGHSPSPEDVLKTERFKQLLGGEVTTQITPLEGDLELTKRAVTDAQDGVTHTLEELDKAKLSIYSGMEDLKIQTDGVASDLNTAKTDIGTALNRADDATRAATDAGNQVRDFDGKLTDTNKKLTTATNNIADLSSRSLTHKQKEDLTDITDSLQVLRSGDNNTLEGLALQRIIALSGNGKDISAYLASNALPAVLKAGITNFGTPQEREQVEITHQGTGHIGNLYFEGNQIDFRTRRDTDPYLSIGAEESQFIGQFISTARLDDTPVSVRSVTLTTSTTSYERTVDVANDGTRLTVTIDSIKIETYGGAKTRLTLDGEVLAEWRGKEYKNHGGSLTGGDIEITQEPYTASDLYYERGVKAGRHTLRLEIAQPTDGATATVRGLRVRRRYDTGRQQSALTKSGLRLFGSPDRYLDVDYRKEYYNPPSAGGYVGWIDNDYTVRIKGGAKVDKLTADELDMPGVPLCGATFNEYGTKINSFGERAKQQGTSVAQAYRAYNTDFYRVYHSIGHKNYIPVLQVYGLSNGNYTQCLTTRIDAIEADSFAVRIVTTGNVSVKHSFSYVAFKTTE